MAEVRAFADSAGAAYTDLIEAEIKQEAERKQSIETRGLAVVTSTGVIAGIAVALAPLLGFGAQKASSAAAPVGVVVSGVGIGAAQATGPAPLPGAAIALLVIGAVALAVAVVYGILSNAPTVYEVAQTNALERLTAEAFWNGSRALGSRRAAEVRVDELRKSRTANSRKSSRLQVAMLMEAIGILCLGAVGLIALVATTVPTN